MTVGGTLALHARSVGAVDVKITSQKFEVIDNKLADLKLNTDVRVTGELRKPKVEGLIEVENGTRASAPSGVRHSICSARSACDGRWIS